MNVYGMKEWNMGSNGKESLEHTVSRPVNEIQVLSPDLQANISLFRRTGLKYNRLVQVNTMALNSVCLEGSMVHWGLPDGDKPGEDSFFIFDGTQFVSAGPTGWNICRFGVTLIHQVGDEFVQLRVYQYPKCNTDVKIAYDKLQLRLAFLKGNNDPMLSTDKSGDEIILQAGVTMYRGQKCDLSTCACHKEKREVMCTRNYAFMTIAQLEKIMEPMKSVGESMFYKMNLFSSLDLCSHNNSFIETLIERPEESCRLSTTHKEVMKRIFNENLCADIKLKIGDTYLDCHRCILAGHSQVFDAMLQADMKEKNTGIIDIVDLSEECVMALLNYLYLVDNSKMHSDPEIALELFKAGDKYAVSHLRETARECLLAFNPDQVDIGFTLDLFLRSKLDEDLPLEMKSIEMIKAKSQDLDTSDVFHSFLQENPKLAANLFKAVLKF